jgi:cell division protein FtsB
MITCSPARTMADSISDPTVVEQQRKIDALTQQMEQMKQEKAALQSNVQTLNYTSGAVFGNQNRNSAQVRDPMEFGLLL